MKKTFHYDLFILFIIIAVIIGLFFMNSQDTGHYVKINYHKKNYGLYNLNENQIININDENILIIKNQEIYMSKATCPDKTCIKQGHINKKGSSIICLPHQLIVEIIDGEDGEIDGQVY